MALLLLPHFNRRSPIHLTVQSLILCYSAAPALSVHSPRPMSKCLCVCAIHRPCSLNSVALSSHRPGPFFHRQISLHRCSVMSIRIANVHTNQTCVRHDQTEIGYMPVYPSLFLDKQLCDMLFAVV